MNEDSTLHLETDFTSLAESKKGIKVFQRRSVENQKGVNYRQTLYSNCTLLISRVLSWDFAQQLRPSGSQQNMAEQR